MKFYKHIYDTVYREGYHSDYNYSHSKSLCNWLEENIDFFSLLDVGCSHGWVIRRFPNKMVRGIDVAEKAIEMAGDLATLASVTDIPFPDKTFDVVHSTDMMEHLKPEDVDTAISEIRRVAKDYIAMKIATRVDQAGWKNYVGHNLHLTIEGIPWWINKFSEEGDEVIYRNGDTFVLRLHKG